MCYTQPVEKPASLGFFDSLLYFLDRLDDVYMPTPLKRTPEELHKTYINNTEAFYKAAGRQYSSETDSFITQCALGLWANSGGVTQFHVDAINSIYSKGQKKPAMLLWELTGKVCGENPFLPPLFFWKLAEDDAKNKSTASRLFIRVCTNILLYLAAADDDVSGAEAEYIESCTAKLGAICDSAGVLKSKAPISAADFITSGEPAFTDKRYFTAQLQAPAADCPDSEEQAAVYDIDQLMSELDELVGLTDVKKDVKSLINLMKVRKLRIENELPVPPMSLHLVFTGNPGTGKTTVARLISKLYAAIGVLSKGQLVEVDRSALVAGYVGQTAIKTSEAIDKSVGGVLFIDEAYSLSSGGENDFGREAIETILKAMEDKRDDLVVIVAGYTEPMEKFLSSNPGLESRFNKHIDFPDYTGDELFSIFEKLCVKNHYVMTDDAREHASRFFNSLYESRDDNFGNGRDVRNCFEDMISRQADRVAVMEEPSKDDLMSVLKSDIDPSISGDISK